MRRLALGFPSEPRFSGYITPESKVRDGSITNSLEYQRDIYLMFANAMMYNRPGSEIYKMTEAVSMYFPHASVCDSLVLDR